MQGNKGAYIAGLSGSTNYQGNTDDEFEAFKAGVQSNQESQNIPGFFQDSVSQDDQGNLVRDKNIYQEQLENIQNQDDAFDFINSLQNESIPGGGFLPKSMNPQMVSQQPLFDMNNLRYIKDPLVATGAFTTDPNEERNVYQLLINKMLQGNQSQMSGAQPLSPGAVEGLRRIGPTNFVDPALSQGFFGDVKSLFTGDNAAAVNLSDLPGGGIAELPYFGQAGLDFTQSEGIKDYGKIIEGLITAATPLKYGKMLAGKTTGGFKDFYDSLYPNRKESEDELDTLIDSIEERNEGDLAKEILFGLESDENKNKKKEFFFF